MYNAAQKERYERESLRDESAGSILVELGKLLKSRAYYYNTAKQLEQDGENPLTALVKAGGNRTRILALKSEARDRGILDDLF